MVFMGVSENCIVWSSGEKGLTASVEWEWIFCSKDHQDDKMSLGAYSCTLCIGSSVIYQQHMGLGT